MLKNCRKDFPFLKNNPKTIYFDNAATSLKPHSIVNAILKYYLEDNSNGSRSEHKIAYKCQEMLLKSKNKIKEFINAKDISEIIFNSGTTDGLNMVARMLEDVIKKDDEIVLTEVDHTSNLVPWFALAKRNKAKIIWVKANENNVITKDNLKSVFTSKTKIVAMNHISNTIGKINEIHKIGKFLENKKCYYVVDAAQSIIHEIVDVQKIKCDFLVFSGHKMLAPTGIGVLYCALKYLLLFDAPKHGGGSLDKIYYDGNFTYKNDKKFEPGTPNYAGIYGMLAAIEYIEKIGLENIISYEKKLTQYLMEKMKDVKNIEIYNLNADIPIICFNIQNVFCQDVGQELDIHNICVRTGDNCVKLISKFSNSENKYVRMSLMFYNTFAEIEKAVQVLNQGEDFLNGLF